MNWRTVLKGGEELQELKTPLCSVFQESWTLKFSHLYAGVKLPRHHDSSFLSVFSFSLLDFSQFSAVNSVTFCFYSKPFRQDCSFFLVGGAGIQEVGVISVHHQFLRSHIFFLPVRSCSVCCIFRGFQMGLLCFLYHKGQMLFCILVEFAVPALGCWEVSSQSLGVVNQNHF